AWLSIVVTVAVVLGVGYLVKLTYFTSETFHYRLTLQADVDGRRVTGTSVFEETVYKFGAKISGEAVSVDLGDGRVPFLLFQAPPGLRGLNTLENLPFEAFPRG